MADQRKILYVENWSRPYTVMIETIQDEFEVFLVENLNDAVTFLKENVIDGVLIDARLPGRIPDALQGYIGSVAKVSATGQLLGAWIAQNRPRVPYAYLTVVPGIIDRVREGDHANFKGVIDKESDDALPDKINAIIRRLFDFP